MGDSFLGIIIAIVIIVVMFSGEPDIADALRGKLLIWAGM